MIKEKIERMNVGMEEKIKKSMEKKRMDKSLGKIIEVEKGRLKWGNVRNIDKVDKLESKKIEESEIKVKIGKKEKII